MGYAGIPDVDFAGVLTETDKFIKSNPHILELIEEDLDAHARKKKSFESGIETGRSSSDSKKRAGKMKSNKQDPMMKMAIMLMCLKFIHVISAYKLDPSRVEMARPPEGVAAIPLVKPPLRFSRKRLSRQHSRANSRINICFAHPGTSGLKGKNGCLFQL